MTKKLIFVMICAAAVSGICHLKNKKVTESNSLLKANILALADSTGKSPGENENKTGIAKIVKTGASLYVTNVSGTASGQVKIGMRISNSLAASLGGEIKAAMKDEYKIECLKIDGANAICSPEDWHACASSGCPKAGTFKNL